MASAPRKGLVRQQKARQARAERIEARQADGILQTINPSKCFFPPACPGCSNCDRMVSVQPW